MDYRKILICIGCGMVQAIAGTIYCTGNIMPYVTSYIGAESGYVSMKSMTIVFYICMFINTLTFQLAAFIRTNYSPKKSIYLGTIIYIIAVFVASAINSRIPMIIVYGVVLGIGCGLCQAPSLMIAISCYPEKKGLITGLIVGCFAIGSFIFNLIATAIVNPSNKKPTLSKRINGVTEKFFEEDISKNVPKMFIVLASIYTFIIILALIMIKDVDKTGKNKETNR